MTLDILKGRKCMIWTFMGNTRMYTALKNYGDRLSQIGLFSFKVDATGTITVRFKAGLEIDTNE